MEGLPYWELSPDFNLFTAMPNSSGREAMVARNQDASLVVAYTPYGDVFELAKEKMPAAFQARWFDPRTGESFVFTPSTTEDHLVFDPPFAPARGNDWVLILEVQ